MKKILDYDWSRAVQLFCNSVHKCVIRAITILKLISQSNAQVSMTTMKA